MFEREHVLFVGNAIACLVVDEFHSDGKYKRLYGTAFFVDPCHLLTAGHNVNRTKNVDRRIYITYPGWPVVDISTSNLLECTLVDTLRNSEKDSPNRDIAILRVNGGHMAGTVLPLVTDSGLSPACFVDVYGYPGVIKSDFMQRHHGLLMDPEKSRKDMTLLLPPRTLTASRGELKGIREQDGIISFRAATCQGMSGGPVICNNRVYGIILCCEVLTF